MNTFCKVTLLVSSAFGLLTNTALSQTTVWSEIEFGTTTEERIVFLFGIPDSVSKNFSWAEIQRLKRAPQPPSNYSLHYNRLERDLPILLGPLGPALSAEIYVKNGRANFIQWNYGLKFKHSAIQRWMTDYEADLRLSGTTIIISKTATEQGPLIIMCQALDTPSSCTGDVTVMLTSEE